VLAAENVEGGNVEPDGDEARASPSIMKETWSPTWAALS